MKIYWVTSNLDWVQGREKMEMFGKRMPEFEFIPITFERFFAFPMRYVHFFNVNVRKTHRVFFTSWRGLLKYEKYIGLVNQ